MTIQDILHRLAGKYDIAEVYHTQNNTICKNWNYTQRAKIQRIHTAGKDRKSKKKI